MLAHCPQIRILRTCNFEPLRAIFGSRIEPTPLPSAACYPGWRVRTARYRARWARTKVLGSSVCLIIIGRGGGDGIQAGGGDRLTSWNEEGRGSGSVSAWCTRGGGEGERHARDEHGADA
jgi:hypothetical protein